MNIAMILAAGRGERLRPLTDAIPKPLCQVRGMALIEHHVLHLSRAGFERIVINHAHLGGQIRQLLGNGSRWGVEICYAPEPPGGLETGGGIFNARPLLGDMPFLTVNADIYTDFNFATLRLTPASMAHLVLINQPTYAQHADFGMSPTGMLSNNHRQYTFAGIACYHPDLFCTLKPGRFSITPLLRQLATNSQATGEIHTGKWIDIGSKQRLQLAQML